MPKGARRDMRRWLAEPAGRAVVAVRAGFAGGAQGRVGMVKADRCPRRCRMVAAIALSPCRRWDVRHRFALCTLRGVAAAVTGCTLPVQASVIHPGRGKGDKSLVAGVAGCRRRHVVDLFAGGLAAVVTAGTGSWLDAGVRIGRRQPGGGAVAVAAGRRRLDVGCRFGLCIGTKIPAAVAALAVAGSDADFRPDAMPAARLDETTRFVGPGWRT